MFITPSFKKSLIVEQFRGNYLKQIATAGADTAAGSKFPPKWDTAHVRKLHPVAWNLTTCNLVPRAHVPFGQHQDTELWNNQLARSQSPRVFFF